MKKNVSRWIQKKGKVLQEVSQDISWYGKKMAKKLTGGIPAKKPPVIREEALPEEDLTVFIPLTDPLEEEQELRDRLNRAIRRAFRKEGGYLYYGQNLVRYVRVIMPAQTDLQEVWVAGYNSCIHPMLRQLEKLEAELDELLPSAGVNRLQLENKPLLDKMRHFRQLALDLRLDTDADWEPEAYRQTLSQYAGELDSELLTPFGAGQE